MEVDGGGGGGGGDTQYVDDKNFTPANNVLFFCHQGFAGLNMFHKQLSQKSDSFLA